MNKYLKAFLHRGLIFSGFGPLITAIVYFSISLSSDNFSVGGTEIFITVISTYLLAFIHAGASVFNQIEHWSPAKSLLFHFSSLYSAYVGCYLVNRWIPVSIIGILIFTAAFALMYLIIYLIVYITIVQTEKKLNKKLHRFV